MNRLLPLGIGALFASGDFLMETALGNPPSVVVSACLVVLSTVTLLAWVVRHLLTRTIPGLAKAHTEQLTKVCAAFERQGERNLQTALALHRDLMDRLKDQGRARTPEKTSP